MQPREIDILIAEKIMDLKTPTYYDFYEEKELPVRGVFVSNYSTDIAAAFTVGEILWPDGWGVQKKHGLWQAGPMYLPFYDTGECVRVIYTLAEADTPAMAICLAALKCKGVEVDRTA